LNQHAELYLLSGDIRLLPGISADDVRHTIEGCLSPLGLAYELQEIAFVPAMETPRSAPIVEALVQSIEEVTGTRPRVEGAGPACDGWMFSSRGIETICGYGVECGGVHGADEWVGLVSLQRITEIYARTILGYLGQTHYAAAAAFVTPKLGLSESRAKGRKGQTASLALPQLQACRKQHLRFLTCR